MEYLRRTTAYVDSRRHDVHCRRSLLFVSQSINLSIYQFIYLFNHHYKHYRYNYYFLQLHVLVRLI